MTPESKSSLSACTLVRIRVRKEDSAYVYSILEANEGLAAYSTLPHGEGDHHRDLELIVPDSFRSEVDELLAYLKTELGGQLDVLTSRSAT